MLRKRPFGRGERPGRLDRARCRLASAASGTTDPKAKPVPKAVAKDTGKTATKNASKDASAPKAANHVPLPRARPQRLAGVPAAKAASPGAPMQPDHCLPADRGSAGPNGPGRLAASATMNTADLAVIKEAITLGRNSKTGAVNDLQKTISDPLARKLTEWVLLRSDNNTADFARYAAFISANPSWPSIGLLRRRAEAMLWQEHADPATVRAFFGKDPPLSAKGRLALARALLAFGDGAGAQAQVREAWRNEALSIDLEDPL